MKELDASECRVQILICTNERSAPKTACSNFGGMDFYLKFKQKIKESGLYNTHWATRTGCLGFCSDGTTVVIRRSGEEPRWYNEVLLEDFDLIWKEATK